MTARRLPEDFLRQVAIRVTSIVTGGLILLLARLLLRWWSGPIPLPL